jgi:hypothetical protein
MRSPARGGYTLRRRRWMVMRPDRGLVIFLAQRGSYR